MRLNAATLAFGFSSAGHFLFHYFAAMYFTIVLAIEKDWTARFEDLVELWLPASVLIGLAALPAGRIADKWSSPGMLAVMFIGMGVGTFLCGFAGGEGSLTIFLALIGLFGAIYHPVGIPWLIKNSVERTGVKLAVNGLFGGLGAAAAGGLTGLLVEVLGWRMAFAIPGAVCIALGVMMIVLMARGRIVEGIRNAGAGADGKSRGGNLKAFAILLFPMFVIGLVYNTVQAVMPKLLEERAVDLMGGEIALIGATVTGIYAVGAVFQMAAGWLADRYSLKWIYVGTWLTMAPLLLVAAEIGGVPLILVSMLLVMAGTGALPAENIMLSRFAPAEHQGVAFGVKFVLAFGAAPMGVWLIKTVREATGDFAWLLLGLGILAAAAFCVAVLLPKDEGVVRAQPAE